MKAQYNVLFLCTGNSARSILAEAILNFKGRPTFTAYSAGSHPTGRFGQKLFGKLEQVHLPVTGLRSKSWEEFSKPGSPTLDFVCTVCDKCSQGSLPSMARTADDGTLGYS